MRLLLALTIGLMLMAQGGDPPDDPQPEWPGQKLSCDNGFDTPHKCQCAIAQKTDCKKQIKDEDLSGNDGSMPRCFTWCKRSHCHCGNVCTT